MPPRSKSSSRLLHLCLALHSTFLLLSLRHEAIFLLCLSLTLATWLEMHRMEEEEEEKEGLVTTEIHRKRCWRDIYRGIDYVLFAEVSFFGTGWLAGKGSLQRKHLLF